MRRSRMALLGLITAAGMLLAPAAAQAGTAPGGSPRPAAVPTMSRQFTLPASACAALRRDLHNERANCSATERLRLVRIRPTATRHLRVGTAAGTYYEGYGTICGGAVGGPCKSWWVSLHFGFTVEGAQAWVNNFNQATWCTAGGTNIVSCIPSGNGSSVLVIEAHFGSGGAGYFAIGVFPGSGAGLYQLAGGDGSYSWYAPSWANKGGGCVLLGTGCYG